MAFRRTTDLAVEARELCSAEGKKLHGVICEETEERGVKLTRVQITSAAGEHAIGKPKGRYTTIDLPAKWQVDTELFTAVMEVMAGELGAQLSLTPEDTVLVAGLGNDAVTPDALGPLALRSVMVTRHLRDSLPDWFREAGLRPVAAIAPGVLGTTGVETAETLRGVVERIRPDAVIVIDALAARRLSRLAATVQIADTGIRPGSGVGNARGEISSQSLGVPVISVGVPTVVDAATLACDVIEMAEDRSEGGSAAPTDEKHGRPGSGSVLDVPDEERYGRIRDLLAPYDMNLVVTPKSVDVLIRDIARLLGFAVNTAMHGPLPLVEMTRFVS